MDPRMELKTNYNFTKGPRTKLRYQTKENQS